MPEEPDTFEGEAPLSLRSAFAEHAKQQEDNFSPHPQASEQPDPVVEDEPVVTDEGLDDPLADLLTGGKDDAPTAETDDEFDQKFVDEPENLRKDKKGLAAWGDLKKEAKSARQEARAKEAELTRIKQEYEAFKNSAPSGSDEYKAKYEAVIEQDARLKLQEDPQFQQNVLVPLAAAEDEVKKIAAAYNIPLAQVEEAIFKTESRTERNRALYKLATEAEMNEFDRADFAAVAQDYLVLEAKRDEGFTEAKKIYESSKTGRELQAQQEQQKKFESLLAEKIKIEDTLKKSPVISEFLGKVDKGKLDTYLRDEIDPKLKVYHGYAGLLLPALREEINSLRAALKEHAGGSHRTGPGGSIARNPDPKNEDDAPPGSLLGAAVRDWRKSR